MLSPKFRLALAVTLACAAVAFLAVTLNAAKTRESIEAGPPPLKARILRSKDKLKAKPDAAELAALRKAAKAQATPEERQLEDTTPKHVPIKVKIKAEKEKSFKDLTNDKWLRELEIDVTNTGAKPIYFLHLQLHLDTVGPDGKKPVLVLLYGRSALVDVTAPIKAEDIPINPGDTHTFSIPVQDIRGYEGIVREFNVKHPQRVKVIFQQITFGDGTGLWNASGEPLPRQKRATSNPCKKGGETQKATTNWPLVAFNAFGKSRWFESLPAFTPASFLSAEETDRIPIKVTIEPDVCCPGSSCTWAKPSLQRCYCSNRENSEPDIPSVEFPACGDSSGGCSSITSNPRWCEYPNVDGTTFTLSCTVSTVFSCFDYAPTPPPPPSPSPTPSTQPSPTATPTPTPEPTCDPATKPNNTNCVCDTTPAIFAIGPPRWNCDLFCSGATGANYIQFPGTPGYAGCPSNKYNDGTNCCRCIVQTCPDGQAANVSTCECPPPMPTPTPTQNQPGGGGPVYYQGCVDYYWVWFVSYDGGVTWEATGEWEYAGCFYVY